MEDYSPSIQNLDIAITFANEIIADPNTPKETKELYQKYLIIFISTQMLNMDNLVANCNGK